MLVFKIQWKTLLLTNSKHNFRQQQQRQSQANILSSLRGSAGSSGIAGLAQALSGQANLAAQQSSASIGMQERQNQMASAQGAMQAQQMILGGADQARNLEMSKTATLLGMSQQRLGAAKEALAQNDAAMYQGIGAAGGMLAGAMAGGIPGGGAGGNAVDAVSGFDGNFTTDRPFGGDLPDFGGGRSSVNGKPYVDDSMFRASR